VATFPAARDRSGEKIDPKSSEAIPDESAIHYLRHAVSAPLSGLIRHASPAFGCPSTNGPTNQFRIILNTFSFFERSCVHLVHKPFIKN
jgi:hypothetical protein